MFNINLTLIIQLIHFGIAYILIRRFLFAESIVVIEREDQYKNQLVHSIDTYNEHIDATQEKLKEDWQACRSYCRAHAPESFVSFPIPKTTQASFDFPDDTDSLYIKNVKHVADFLITEARRVRQ